MKKSIVGCVLSLVVCFGASSCVSTRPPIPAGCEGSLIYPIHTEWAIGAGVIKIGVLEVIKRNPELRQPTLDVLGTLKYALGQESTTYMEFAAAVILNIKELNEYVDSTSALAATEIITQVFTREAVAIDRCDRDLLLRDVSQLSLWVGMI